MRGPPGTVYFMNAGEGSAESEDMTHTFRIVPIGATHGKDLDPVPVGHSIGFWEGDTLVVDVVAIDPDTWLDGDGDFHDENLHVVERFTRVSPNRLDYQVTVDDPTTWVKPWTLMIPLKKTNEEIYEYACHESNEGMVGILSGARAKEKAATK